MNRNLEVRTVPTATMNSRFRSSLLAGTILLVIISLLAFTPRAFAQAEPMLNLSHIECVGQQVEVHFVVVNLPDGITPGALTFYGTWPGGTGSATIPEPTAHTGNVYHYSWFGTDGYYEITGGEVALSDGTTLSLHNPGDYTGDYMCQCGGTASCSGWEFHFMHPLRTDATITVYALIDRHWQQVGYGTAVRNLNPMTTVTGNWTKTMPTAQTEIRFMVNYGHKTYIEKATRPECLSGGQTPSVSSANPTISTETQPVQVRAERTHASKHTDAEKLARQARQQMLMLLGGKR